MNLLECLQLFRVYAFRVWSVLKLVKKTLLFACSQPISIWSHKVINTKTNASQPWNDQLGLCGWWHSASKLVWDHVTVWTVVCGTNTVTHSTTFVSPVMSCASLPLTEYRIARKIVHNTTRDYMARL